MVPKHKSAEPDRVLQQSLRLAFEEASVMGTAGSARPLRRGEDLETSDVAEADHWISVYRELAQFSRELLAEVAPGGRAGSVSHTRIALELELKLHELHLRYWQHRSQQLRAKFHDAHLNGNDRGG